MEKLAGVCRAIERDYLTGQVRIAGILEGPYVSDPELTGIGVMERDNGDEYIEIRVAAGADVARLSAEIRRRYGLPVRALSVQIGSVAQALRSLVRIGDAVGHHACNCYGTVGAFVRAGNRHFILSNSHVLALEGHASIGDAILDGQGSAVAVLTLATAFDPTRFHLVDAALAELMVGTWASVGQPLSSRQAQRHARVRKHGATTGQTYGRVLSTDYAVKVEMGMGPIWFRNQIAIESLAYGAFSDGGDSGSMVHDLADPSKIYGLLFAGDKGGFMPRSYANHFHHVAQTLGL